MYRSLTRPKSRNDFRTLYHLLYLKSILANRKWVPHPLDILYVNPSKIKYCIYPPLHYSSPQIKKRYSYTLSGDWDSASVSDHEWFATHWFPEGLYQSDFDGTVKLKIENYAFTNLVSDWYIDRCTFKQKWKEIRQRFPGCKDSRYWETEHMMRYHEIMKQMEASGYRTQLELSDYRVPEVREVAVYIGRDGTFYSAGFSKHRLVMAQVLGIERIPVWVNVRHEKWAEKRVQKLSNPNNNHTDGCATHPDLCLKDSNFVRGYH